MKGPPLGPGGEDITWPDQVAPQGRKAFMTRKIKPQTSNPTRGHDAIMTVVDRFSKRGMFIPCRKDMTADDIIYVFLREVI